MLTPAVFDTRGVVVRRVDADRVLARRVLGAFLGTLFRRVLPAMAASLAAYLALVAATWTCLHDHYPASAFWPMRAFQAGWLAAHRMCAAGSRDPLARPLPRRASSRATWDLPAAAVASQPQAAGSAGSR